MENIILIGGAEGMGKSTLAKQLAAHFQVPWISTDQIRTILQINELDERKKAELIWKGVVALVKAPHPWGGGIIEGTAILPDLVARDLPDMPDAKAIFLIQENEGRVADIVFERSKLPFIKTKTAEQQAQKVEKIVSFNRAIQEMASISHYACVPAHSDATFEAALRAIA